MRELEINKRTIYYKTFISYAELTNDDGQYTGEFGNTYGALTRCEINVSPANGNVKSEPFGDFKDYTKVMCSCDMSLPINENTVLWVDDLDTTKANDYIVVKVADSINSNLYAIKKVR